MEQDKRRTPWDIISLLIGMLAYAIGIITIQHSDFTALDTKIDAYITANHLEMKDFHERLCEIEAARKG